MQARLQDGGESSEPFSVSNVIKQGSVLAPMLFSLMFFAMLCGAFSGNGTGICIRWRFDGSVFNPRATASEDQGTIWHHHDILFADDCALNATCEANMHRGIDQFSDACDNFGFSINAKKMKEGMCQPAACKPYVEPNITINDQRLNAVPRFKYPVTLKYSLQERCDR